MSGDAWLTLIVVGAAVLAMARDLLPPGPSLFGALVALLAFGVVTPEQGLIGFSNPAPFTIAALYVLARAAGRSGVLPSIVAGLLGERTGTRTALGRLLAPVTVASGFVNNTPIVAVLVPQLERWSERTRRSVSSVLMPLSFAAMLGGLLTVIGTSTTIVISGLLEASGADPLGFFEITPVGAPIAVAGVALIIVTAPILLPQRSTPRDRTDLEMRNYEVDMTVEVGGPLDGASIGDAGLRNLTGVFLAAVHRGDDDVAAVGPGTRLVGGDVLRFVGQIEEIADLQAIKGLTTAALAELEPLTTRHPGSFEAVIGEGSRHIGRTLREIGFRARYQAVVIAIHRSGATVEGKLGSVPLRPGDTLLLLSDPGFKRRWADSGEFLLISESDEGSAIVPRRRGSVGLVLAGVVVATVLGWLPLVTATLAGAVAFVALGVMTPSEARDAIDLDVIITIAAAFGLAEAMSRSGLARTIADTVLAASDWAGPRGVLIGSMVATILVSSVITNNAAALLVFPIALEAASSVGGEPRAFAIGLAVAATASFLTPIGYQTNTMVYGPGGYRFTDYARLGGPLTVLVLAMAAWLIPIMWPA